MRRPGAVFGLAGALLALSLVGCAKDKGLPVLQPSAPGWYAVPTAPGFRILEEVHQVLPGTPALVWDVPGANLTLAGTDESETHVVTRRFALSVPDGVTRRLLRLRFAKPLEGMKFEAVATAKSGATLSLMDDHRVFDDTVSVEWPTAEIKEVAISAHVHLKQMPTISGFQLGWRVPLKTLKVDPGFQKDGLLYFFNPDGRALHLCSLPMKNELGVPMSMLAGTKPSPASTAPGK